MAELGEGSSSSFQDYQFTFESYLQDSGRIEADVSITHIVIAGPYPY
jgi:hypothetical protein